MKILHTADWHLGRVLHQVSMLEDQAWVLERLLELVRSERPDLVLLAGDVYDRAVPPADAVELLDHVLGELVLGAGVPVVAIAGNHDSPERLAFGRRLLEARRLHVVGRLIAAAGPIVFEDGAGPVHVWAVPYAEPARVREALPGCAARSHDEAMRAWFDAVRARKAWGVRALAVAHAFVAGGRECESERPLAVGGTGAVDPACFAGFEYAALGHLHRPQSVGSERVRYSGSPLKYSFSEADDAKSVAWIELSPSGEASVRTVPLGARRDLRRVSGTLADLLAPAARVAPGTEDWLEITLLDPGPVWEPMRRLREAYPNVLHVRSAPAGATGLPGATARPAIDLRALSEEVLFARFFDQMIGRPLSDQEAAEVADAAQAVRAREGA